MLIFISIWIICGILGCRVYNKILKYETKEVKYAWNILVFLSGIFGLLCALLTLSSSKIK